MSDSVNNPFKKLKGLKVKKNLNIPLPKPKPAPQPAPPEEDDEAAFARAMSGVKPIEEEKKGRDLTPVSKPTPPAAVDPDAEARAKLFDLVAGNVEFELEFTNEFAQGFVRGMDQKIFRQLRAGRLSPEAHIDLHGLNSDQARAAVLHFVRERYLEGKRCLLVIPGRGLNSPGGYPILKKEIESWLTRDPLRRVVLAFCTAQPRHGGAGALYVLLRKYKKIQGKVRWESYWDDFE